MATLQNSLPALFVTGIPPPTSLMKVIPFGEAGEEGITASRPLRLRILTASQLRQTNETVKNRPTKAFIGI
jgi:hypothetical protein